MNDTLQRMRDRLQALNERLTTGQKLTIVALATLLIGAVVALGWFASQPDFRPLYSGLDVKEAGKVRDWLAENNVPFQISGGGSTVEVPGERVHELRLQLASAGLAGGGGVGYELIDQNEMFGMPDDVIQVNKRRMLEGELARSVATLQEVNSARVHLAIPPESLFVEDQKPATASVILDMHPTVQLSARQVQGIVNLVAGAVPRLDPDQVTVVDQRGRVLNRQHGDMVDGSSTLEFEDELERRLEQKAQDVLAKIVGPGKAIVRVQAEVDFSREERTEELYDPEKSVVRSEETLNEVRENGANRVGGAAGANPNDPNVAQGVVRVGDASNSSREKVVTNYEVDKVVKRVMGPGARLKRLSVAVVVDGKYEAAAAGEAPAEEDAEAAPAMAYVARTAAEMKTIEKQVAKAVGLDTERGDSLEVANVQFAQEEVGTGVPELTWAQWFAKHWQVLLSWLVVLLVALLLIFKVFSPMVRSLTEKPETAEVLADGELPPGEQQLALPGEEQLRELEKAEPSIIDKIREYAQANPETAASVMRYWLKARAQAET
ncbi:MAG: flagellar M-ring protein FliF [Myxococcales bacterium]|nr:flagellar M-ring protein FliF [Myxococcales bacterium]MCB9536354.1 flagellar M-ring protein FliF [Myxococcales bacterium]